MFHPPSECGDMFTYGAAVYTGWTELTRHAVSATYMYMERYQVAAHFFNTATSHP